MYVDDVRGLFSAPSDRTDIASTCSVFKVRITVEIGLPHVSQCRTGPARFNVKGRCEAKELL